jgi:hypothetical protein
MIRTVVFAILLLLGLVGPGFAADPCTLTAGSIPTAAGWNAALGCRLNAANNLSDLPSPAAARTNLGVRTKITGTLTLWVIGAAHGGNDATADGTTFGSGFSTVQGAINRVYAKYDTAGLLVLIQIYAPYGPYTGAINVTGALPGGGQIWLQGASGNAVINHTGGDDLTVQLGAQIQISNLTFATATSGNCINVTENGRILAYTNITFGACASGHIVASSGGEYYALNDYTISAGAPYHVHVNTGGRIVWNAINITVSGTPNFSNYFAGVGVLGSIYAIGTTITGGATGQRCVVHYNGVVRANLTEAQAATFFPGDQDCQIYQGGVFDFLGASPGRRTRASAQTGPFTLTIPAGARIEAIVIDNGTANAIIGGINIGTSAGGADVVSAIAVPGNALVDAPPAKRVFSSGASQTLYVSPVTSWNSTQLAVTVLYSDVLSP